MDLSTLPVAWANYLSILGFLILGALVWLIPKRIIFTEAPDQSRWRDMRLWASALIAMQLALYTLFT
ncbi:MAG: hypothetical protein ACFHXK_20165 [bacterium]